MKKSIKLCLLMFISLLMLASCISPPVPDVDQAISDADPNRVIPISNRDTEGLFQTALPFESSPTRGLIHRTDVTMNRADMEQIERSMMRVATDYFNPNTYFFREGQTLSRDFVVQVLRPASDGSSDGGIGLNPEIGSQLTYGTREVTSRSDEEGQLRPLSFLLEHNYVQIVDGEFELQGVSIVMALNPYHLIIDRSIGFQSLVRMTDDEVLTIGQDMAVELLPLLREQEGLEDVPILLGMFILQAYDEIIPGRLARINHITGNSLNSWVNVHEAHFRLPDTQNQLAEYDPNLNDEYNFFASTIELHYPHHTGIVGRVQIVDRQVYQVNITFNMHFLGFSEKLSFHQFVANYANEFSPHYDIRILIRSPQAIHGVVTRPPYSQAFIHQVSW